ncbi:MAG: hypothetical protein ACPL25_09755 [Ignavibacteria bacterium]
MKSILFIVLFVANSFCQVKDVYEYGSKVNDYIAKNLIKSEEREINLAQVDSIFSFSLSIADSNIGDALLFCSIGTMTYPIFKMKLPIFNFLIPFSIFTYTNEYMLKQKVKNLPSILFDDSPRTDFGDKDKVVHFFTLAYLSYTFGNNFAEHFGKFVEHFEEDFKIDGKVDERDLKINQLGSEFGQMLRCKIILPSIILAKEKSLSYGKNINN